MFKTAPQSVDGLAVFISSPQNSEKYRIGSACRSYNAPKVLGPGIWLTLSIQSFRCGRKCIYFFSLLVMFVNGAKKIFQTTNWWNVYKRLELHVRYVHTYYRDTKVFLLKKIHCTHPYARDWWTKHSFVVWLKLWRQEIDSLRYIYVSPRGMLP